MHSVETGVCCDHGCARGECRHWGCRYRDQRVKEPKEEDKGEEVMKGNAGGVATSSSSPATTTSLSSSPLSSFSSCFIIITGSKPCMGSAATPALPSSLPPCLPHHIHPGHPFLAAPFYQYGGPHFASFPLRSFSSPSSPFVFPSSPFFFSSPSSFSYVRDLLSLSRGPLPPSPLPPCLPPPDHFEFAPPSWLLTKGGEAEERQGEGGEEMEAENGWREDVRGRRR